MKESAVIIHDMKDRIMAEPDVILEDRDVMRALISADERRQGNNIVDLRGIAMERLEARLERLEDTHRSVIAAAYENLAGTNQVHRAVLSLLEPTDFTSFLKNLGGDIATILRVARVRLALETKDASEDPMLEPLEGVLCAVEPGFIEELLSDGSDVAPRKVTLRATTPESRALYGTGGDAIHSEALLKLDFGAGRLPGLLVLGSEDPAQFGAAHGTDLMTFFSSVVERAILRWIA